MGEYREIISKTPHRGLRMDRGNDAEVREFLALEAQMAKDNGWTGNWRTGPNPRDYAGLINTWDWNSEDWNNYCLQADQQIMQLRGDGSGKHYRVPMGGNMLTGTPLEMLAKSDDVLNTGDDTGAWSYIFGHEIFVQTLEQQNAWGAMQKEGYLKGGYRAKSASAATSGMGSTQATTAKDSAHPTFTEVSVGLKEHQLSVAMSTRLIVMQGKDDVVYWDETLQNALTEFWTSMDADLLGDSDTTANLNVESLDRACSSYACIITGHSYTAGDDNMYGLTRSSYAWMDGTVSHGSDTDRALETSFLDTVLAGAAPYWTTVHGGKSWDSKMWITGYDTLLDLSNLESPKHRYQGVNTVHQLPGGLQEFPGQPGGFILDSYDNIKLVPDSTVTTDTSASRMMLVDGDAMKIAIGRPMDVVVSDNRLVTGLYTKANIYLIAELTVRRWKGSGSIWDLA